MSKLTNEYTFTLITDPYYMGTKYPIVIAKDNGDGTVLGKFNLDKMNTVKKVLALTA